MIKLLIKRNLKYFFKNNSLISYILLTALAVIYFITVDHNISYDELKRLFILLSIVLSVSTVSEISIDYLSDNLSDNNIFSVYPVTRRDYILSSYILTVIHTFIKLLFGIVFIAIIHYRTINEMLTAKYALFLLNIFIVMLITTSAGLFFTHTITPKSKIGLVFSEVLFALFINAYMSCYNNKLTVAAIIMLLLTYYFCYTLSLNTYKNTDF